MTAQAHALPLLLAAALTATGAGAEAPLPEGASACKVMQASGVTFCKFGNRWIATTARAPALAVGDPFPIYEQSMLMELDRYGLPPVDGPWRYFRRDGVIYKVSARDGRVIEILGRRTRR
ncbi:hypothetical protein SDC9_18924 [bioreactor metagenome]|uniref:Uncharacterized protein n=1 Tax=bioreactor metagenome TaxID=1076179 RepID=A0A644U3X6_9ZZZZ